MGTLSSSSAHEFATITPCGTDVVMDNRWISAFAFVLLTGCGGGTPSGECTGDECECTDATCDCPATGSCAQDCTTGCVLGCSDGADCDFSCGDGCLAECPGSGSCDVEVGDGSTVVCDGSGGCDVVCHGNCNVTCPGSGTCRVTCGDDDICLLQACEPVSCPDGSSVCNGGC